MLKPALIGVRVPESLADAVTQAAIKHRLDKPTFVRLALAQAVEAGLFNPHSLENDQDLLREGNREKYSGI